MRYLGEYRWAIYDIESPKIVDIKEDALLDLIQCSRSSVPAGIDPGVIEQYAQEAKLLWVHAQGIEFPEAVERVCALYLQPTAANQHFEGRIF
jgi:hypothetical protein